MAPRGTKRKSDESVSATGHVEDAPELASQSIATKTGAPTQSPRKRQKTVISSNQKQALIDNIQLEITERARKLRAQYNLQAQGIRTRIEIRVNRIPMALRKAKIGELADKYKAGQHPQQMKPTPSAAFSVSRPIRPPPVPEKDTPVARTEISLSAASHGTKTSRPGPGRPPKRASGEISGSSKSSGDSMEPEAPKKKSRTEVDSKASNVLSPASANVRPLPRPTPAAGKPILIRPTPLPENAPGPTKSPVKQSSTSSLFSSLAEKARSTRKDAGSKRGNPSTSTTASSATGSTRGRKPDVSSASGTTKGAPSAKTQRRVSGISESSESSTGTVIKKKSTAKGAAAEKKTAPTKRPGVMGTIRRGVTKASAAKKATATPAAPASTATGRVLRKRNQ